MPYFSLHHLKEADPTQSLAAAKHDVWYLEKVEFIVALAAKLKLFFIFFSFPNLLLLIQR